VLTLALGIGANTAIFSVFYGVLLRPLPYPNPDRLVRLWEVNEKGGQMSFADPNFEDVQAQNRSLQGLAQYAFFPEVVTNGQESARVTACMASKDFFQVIGIQPARGRNFAPEEQRLNAPLVVLISDAYWKQSLGAREDLSSVRLKLGGKPATIIGVMPPGFRFPENADLWYPRETYERYPSRTAHNWKVLGRLGNGFSVGQSRAELSSIAAGLRQQYGQDTMMISVAVEPLRESMTGNVRLALTVLLGASVFFLLIACANVVNLMLAQSAARGRELAMRAALGAGRGRLVRQFLTEAFLLTLIGGGLGVLVAFWGTDVLLGIAPKTLPRLAEVSINLPVLLFSLGIAVVIAGGLGIICARRPESAGSTEGLSDGNLRLGSTPRKQVLGRLVLAGQLATAMTLLVGAGLTGRSLLRVLSVDPGFRTDKVLTMELDLPDEPKLARRVQLLDEMFARLRTIPGVEEVGGTTVLPLLPGFEPDGAFVVMNPGQISPRMQDLIRRSLDGSIETDPVLAAEFSKFFDDLFHDRAHLGEADYQAVSQGYFQTVGIPLVRGRLFDERDGPETQPVAVISESVARQKWPNEDPVGQTIEFGNMDGDPRLLTIAGVVRDVRVASLEAPPPPTVYVNYRQRPRALSQFRVVMRTSAEPAAVFASAREIVRGLNPELAPRFNSFSRIYSASFGDRRFSVTLVVIFSVTALFLAMAGIYGVNAYSVARRTREIGIRMALGASPGGVRKTIVKQAAVTALMGVVAGTIGSLLLTRWMQSLLFEVSPADPITFCGVALMLVLAAVMACWIPARYASRVDPMVALRYE